MHAVGVEGGEGGLRRVVAAQVEPDLAALVAHDQLATCERGRQRDHEGREHARRLLGITMADEEAALIIEQQLVELGCDRGIDAEPLCDAGQDCLQRPDPVPAADAHPIRADLPATPNRRVDHGLLATTVGGGFGNANELPGLDRQQGQRHGAGPLDLQQRGQQLGCAGGEEVAGPPNFAQHRSDVGRDHGYEACRRNADERGRWYGKGAALTTASTNVKPHSPRRFEAIGCELGVAHRALDVLMPGYLLQARVSWPSFRQPHAVSLEALRRATVGCGRVPDCPRLRVPPRAGLRGEEHLDAGATPGSADVAAALPA